MGRRKRTMHLQFRIKEVATQKGYTRTRLSKKSEVGYATINALWNNKHKDAMEVTLIRISRVLQVPTTDLYEVVEDE